MTEDNRTIPDTALVELTAEIVSAYVSNNAIVASELPEVIESVSESLSKVAHKASKPPEEERTPAVPKSKSIKGDYIICLEDGKKFKSLKRHLRTHHDMTPDEYRERWKLPFDYPMVAPNYAEARSRLAKKMGLGRKNKP